MEEITFKGKKITCWTCGGTGWVIRGVHQIPMTCPDCKGQGVIVLLDNPKGYIIVG